jgi:hypothetical protein
LADVSQSAPHGVQAAAGVFRGGEELSSFGGDALGREIVLNQFRHDGAASDEIDHAEKFGAHERLREARGERRKTVNDNHGLAEEGGFDGGGAAGDDGEVGGGESVVSVILNESHRVTGRKFRLQLREIKAGGDRNDDLRRRVHLFADLGQGFHEHRNMMRDFAAAAAGKNRQDSALLIKTVFHAE